MKNPNIPELIRTDEAHELTQLDEEMEQHLHEKAPDLITPFGTREMIDVKIDIAIGALACINMLNTSVDDMPGGPNPDGTLMMQDPGIELESRKPAPDVFNLS